MEDKNIEPLSLIPQWSMSSKLISRRLFQQVNPLKKNFKANNNMMMHKIGTELSLDLQWGHRVNMLNYFFRFLPSHSVFRVYILQRMKHTTLYCSISTKRMIVLGPQSFTSLMPDLHQGCSKSQNRSDLQISHIFGKLSSF